MSAPPHEIHRGAGARVALKLDELTTALHRALGSGGVQLAPGALRACTVDGITPHVRIAPADVEQIAAALRLCAEHAAAVVPWGGGTAMHWGNVPRHADVALSLERLTELVEHDDANLTATVQAGVPLASLQESLGRRKQFLAVDAPRPQRATVGGIVAANTNGPRRMFYGSVRDLVIGMKVVLADGTPIKAGGKVVKNVAGYDMCKLFVGSLGTLGVITEATFKMAPEPETAKTVLARGSLAQAAQLAREVFASPLIPAAVAIVHGEVAVSAGFPGESVSVAVWAEGFDEAVSRHVRDVTNMAERGGMAADVLDGAAHLRLWEVLRDFGADGMAPAAVRVTVPPAAVMDVIAAVQQPQDGAPARFVAHAGAGTVWLTVTDAASAPAWIARLTPMAAERHGHVVLGSAPPEVKRKLDVWGPPPPTLSLMKDLKSQFDPHGLLNPGRFVARL
jgi:glycolate oxidase FAD binding subunit